MHPRRSIKLALLAAGICGSLAAQLAPPQQALNLESFETVWRTVRDRHPDASLNGLDWQAVHDSTRPLIENAQSMGEVRQTLATMLSRLASSHYAIIPGDRYKPSDFKPVGNPPLLSTESGKPAGDSPRGIAAGPVSSAAAPPEDAVPDHGTLVRFGNLPETRLYFESRTLPNGAGYIRFNEFLDPASIMPQFEKALKGFAKAPGIILDLRGNPGGIGIMGMGIAGFFIDKDGQKLGEMKMRDATMKFAIFPRPDTYSGPLAILVDAGSASTSEILAAGLQDLKRARIFGTRTAGAALPSDIVRLPNGDGFQYPQASYTSVSGRVLEGEGVTPDVIVEQSRETASGSDPVIDAAAEWIRAAPG